jgi:GNAT superfamily N-acetyltransferase
MTYDIDDLRSCPAHVPVIAGWIHREWWSTSETTVDGIAEWLKTHLQDNGFPTTLVATFAGKPVGSVCLHRSEAEDRPEFTPYLGALYITPNARGIGIGKALVQALELRAEQLGKSALYLNAANRMVVFYADLGWGVVERNYGANDLNIMRKRIGRAF